MTKFEGVPNNLEWEDDFILSAGETLKERILESDGEFSETISITPRGFLEMPTKKEDPMLSFFAHLGGKSPEAFMRLARAVQEKFPELEFSFEKDTEGKWIKYTATEKR